MKLERAQLGLLAALAAALPASIFASQLVLALGGLVLAARLASGAARLQRTPLDAPLLAFTVWTLLSASFSASPTLSHEDAKKLLLFTLFYIAVGVLSTPDARERVLSALLVGGLALATLVVLQYHLMGYDTLGHRPSGLLGHYMSASGVIMGTVVVAAARLTQGQAGPSRSHVVLVGAVLAAAAAVAAARAEGTFGVLATRLYVAALAALGAWLALSRRLSARGACGAAALVVLPVGLWALAVGQTRNAWLGVLAGIAVVALLRRPRLLWVLVAAAVLVLLLRPAAVTERLTVADASSLDRYYMWQAGVDMVLDKPVFGQGPGMILEVYPRYRWPEAPNPLTPHLHNNALQIAAERGLPALAFFLWWTVTALADAWRETRHALAEPGAGELWSAAAALGGFVAILVAGLFEYNLGDSEVLMLALLLSALPYARRRGRVA